MSVDTMPTMGRGDERHRRTAPEMKRHRIVATLLAAEGWVSGELLATQMGVSRVAIHKHIRQLIAAGVPIIASHSGYALRLEWGEVYPYVAEAMLRRAGFSVSVDVHDRLESTQDEALALADATAPAWSVVIARHQSAGRGRIDRRWMEAAAGFAVSIVIRPNISPARAPLLSLAVGRSVVEAIDATTSAKTLLKWPNDVLLQGPDGSIVGKVGGVLIESRTELDRMVFAVCGIGINLAGAPTVPPHPFVAVALADIGAETGRMSLLLETIRAMNERIASLESGTDDMVSWVTERMWGIGGEVEAETPDGIVRGRLEGIDADGAAILFTEGVRRRITAGGLDPARDGR